VNSRTHELDRWVDGIRQRSDDAFRAVYTSMANDLLSFAIGMLGDRRSAEDAVQQGFLELVKAAPGLRGDGRSLRAWLYRSVRFGCLDELRRRRRKPETPTDQLPETLDAPPPPDGLDPHLEAALAQLSDRQRSLVVMRHVVELTPEEIAKVTRSNRTAVYAALGRAERRLRALLDAAPTAPTSTRGTP